MYCVFGNQMFVNRCEGCFGLTVQCKVYWVA